MGISSRPIRAIDLCCGAGGWAFAARRLPIQFVAAIDRWDACCATYARNHAGVEVICRDVTEPAALEWAGALEAIDLVVGGIPCEWLSVLRNIHRGASAAEIAAGRATLDAMLAIVQALAPRWWCLEDVIQIRGELPPLTPFLVLDSAHWSGQRRKRCYVGRFPRPPRARSEALLQDSLRPGPYRLGRRAEGRTPVTREQFSRDTIHAAFPSRKAHTVCALSSRRDAELVVMDRCGPRQLEWQEAAVLQGFPTDTLFIGSPSDCWKMIGQAIQIDTGRAILEAIVREWQSGPRGGTRGADSLAVPAPLRG